MVALSKKISKVVDHPLMSTLQMMITSVQKLSWRKDWSGNKFVKNISMSTVRSRTSSIKTGEDSAQKYVQITFVALILPIKPQIVSTTRV